MPVPTPPATGPDEIDTALSFTVDTGRTDTWVFGGHVKLRGAAYGTHIEYSGQFGATYDTGYFIQGSSSAGEFPYAIAYAEFQIGVYQIRFDLTFQQPSWNNRYYRKGNVTDGLSASPYDYFLHDSSSETSPNSDPATTVGGGGAIGCYATPNIGAQPDFYLGQSSVATFSVFPDDFPAQSAAAGLKYTLTNLETSTIQEGQVNNNGTESARFSGPSSTVTDIHGSPNHAGEYLVDRYTSEHGPNTSLTSTFNAWLAVIDIDDDFTISVDVREVFISRGRGIGEYQWLPVTWTITCGSATFTVTDPFPSAIDCVMQASAGVMQHQNSGHSLGTFADWGYTPDWFGEISDWSVSGTSSGHNFTNLGASASSVVDIGSTGFVTGTLTPTSIRVQFAGSADTPISTTISGHAYTWYVTAPFSISTGSIGNVASGRAVFLNLAPISTNTVSFDERWYDNSVFDRDPADATAVNIAGQIAAWNAAIGGSGTAFALVPVPNLGQPDAILNSTGYILGDAPSVAYGPLTFTPASFAYYGTGISLGAFNWPQWFIKEGGDPFDTNAALGRDIGTLTFTLTPRVLPTIHLSVSSDSMGGSNTDTYSTNTGNWAANRYLKVTCSGISLASGHRATLTIKRHDLHTVVYTLRPDSMTGVAIVDLTCPDDFSQFPFGVGFGLYNPTPSMTPTAGTVTTYSRLVNDVLTPNTGASVAAVILTVPGPLETFDAVVEFDALHTGVDGWTDPLGDGSGWSFQQSDAHNPPPGGSDSHVFYHGEMHVLVDGKPCLTYPYYAKWPLTSHPPGTQQTYWDTPLMVADLLYDLPVMGSGLTASFTPMSIAGASIPITANNCPLGLIWMDNSPIGSNAYVPWGGGTTMAFGFRRKLISLTFPTYCATYSLVGSKLHGGGLEGTAYDRATHAALASGTIDIKHALVALGTRDSTNFPTGTDTVSTDAGGFWRHVFYDKFEAPVIKKMINPMPVQPTGRPPYIRELAYSHFAVLISTRVPGCTNLGTLDGIYHRAGPLFDTEGGPAGIQYWQAPAASPGAWTKGGGTVPIVITGNPDDDNPSLAEDAAARLYCLFDRRDTGTFLCWSDDDGSTWSEPVTSIPGGTNPVIRAGKDGSMFTTAYVDSGSGDAGVIKGFWASTPSGTPSALFTFVDETGTDIPVQPGQYGLDQQSESGARWALEVLIVTETAPSTWLSADDGRTWLRVV